MPTLVMELKSEVDRCRELLKTITPEHVFIRAWIEVAIARAEAAVADNNLVEMAAVYLDLKACE